MSKNEIYLYAVENESGIRIVVVKAKTYELAKKIILDEYSTCNIIPLNYDIDCDELEEIYSFNW